jgi:hypothetical protein
MKMNPITLLFACIVASSVFAAAAESARFEKQLRSDLHAILKGGWPAQKVKEAADAYAEKWLLDLKTSYPDLLPDEAEPTIPTDDQLLTLQAEASVLRALKPRGEIWRFYGENWRSRRLSADQKVLFGRFLGVVISESKNRKRSDAGIQRFDPEIQRLEDELHRLKLEDELQKLKTEPRKTG